MNSKNFRVISPNTLKSSVLFKKISTLRRNNSRVCKIKNAKYSEYYFYMNEDIQGEFQIGISVPLTA